jgi:DNA polymerase (family 10)
MDKEKVAEVLLEIAQLLELQGENPFKSRAYSSAARAIQSHPGDLAELVRDGRLGEIPGLGDALRAKVTELVTTGRLQYHEKLRASFPAGLLELFDIPGLGPKKIKLLHGTLGIDSIDALEAACHAGSIATIPTLGAKTQQNILDGIALRRQFSGQHRYGDVYAAAEAVHDALRSHPAVLRVSLAGSFRRGKEVLKDLDLVASSADPAAVMEAFIALPGVQRVINHGDTKSSVLLEGGLQCDLRVVDDATFPYALHHFTGSKEHNVALRQRAIARGMKLSEWGLFPRTADDDDSHENPRDPAGRIPCRTEGELFAALGLDEIPPELRENLGEIEAADEHALPRLIEWTELRGTFHNHTIASDGHATLEQMAEAARSLGLEYLGIADHSKSSVQANGLDEDRLAQQVAAIRELNRVSEDGFRLFAGSEVDILKDGTLDFDDATLATLDYVVASVHSAFTLDEAAMTRRIIRAVEHPRVTMLGHLTGRLLLDRPPYAVNVQQVIEACAATGTWIELNANPWRLDMDWRWWRIARDLGVKCVINPDAHRATDLGYLRLGVNIARKGWLRRQDVVNTCSVREITRLLARTP